MNTSGTMNETIIPATITHDETTKDIGIELESQTTKKAVQTSTSFSSDDDGNLSSDGAASGDCLVGDSSSPSSSHNLMLMDNAPTTIYEALAAIVFMIGVGGAATVSLFFVEAHQRPMPVQYLESSQEYIINLTNGEKFNGETVDTLSLMLLMVFVPLCIQLAYSAARGRPGDFYRTICVYCVSFTIAGIVTEFIKNYVGYLRPVFFDVCQPDDNYENCTSDAEEMHGVNELHKSFVSGHACFAFCGGVLFSLFLERTIGLSSVEVAVTKKSDTTTTQSTPISPVTFAYRNPPGIRRLGSIVALLPMALAIWVAASRVVDNVHFPADVVGGALLGGSVALYVNPLWFADPRYLL